MIEKEMLNEQQSEFVDKIVAHITNAVENNPDSYKDRFIFLQGLSGAGKTTSTSVIIKELSKVSVRGKPLTIKVTAPTHKALGVLREMVESIGLRNIPVSTIHSHLGLKFTENYKNGTMELQKDQSKTVERFDIIVADEASMVSDALFEYIIEAVDMGKVKAILFVGDTAQLLPVEGKPAPISEPINDFCESLTLTKVVRQAEGNPLIQMANSIRAYIQDNMDNNTTYPSFKTVIDIIKEHTDNEHIIGFNSESEFREHYEANPKAEFESLSLAYTNKKVDMLNTNARNFFKGRGTPYLTEGDTVVFMESYEENGLPLFQNNEVVKLQQVLKAYDDLLDIWYWDCLDDKGRYFRVVDRRSLPDYEYHLSELAKEAKKAPSDERKAKWITYFETKKRFASIAYHYGSTITKSQGSSVKDVYIDLSELDYFSKKQGDLDLIYRLCYVATTRCKERLVYKI